MIGQKAKREQKAKKSMEWHITSAADTKLLPTGYRQKAEEETAFIQANFYDAAAQRYRPSYPQAPGDLPYDFMWGSGVQLTVLAAAARENPAKYQTLLYDFTEGLANYWDAAALVPGYEAYCAKPENPDKYYDDNAWIVLAFTEAYQSTGDPKFLQLARDTQDFVLSGWDDNLGGGIYWRLDQQSKNTCANAPAAASALRIDQVAGDPEQRAWALKIKAWTDQTLQDTDGLYWDNITLDGKINKKKWTYNTALMIHTDVLLYQTRHTPADLAEACRVADAGLVAWTDPVTGSLQKTENSPRFTHLFCEALLRLYDVTHDVRYLNAVRCQAAFGERYARDPQGGYWNHWATQPQRPDEAKTLIENASAARLLWLLAPYPDPAELTAAGQAAAGEGKEAQAESLLRQAADSDIEAVEARFYLWRVLVQAKKQTEADAEAARLTVLSQNPALASRLKLAGWQQQ
jgi:uncharacterized protein YyaL (SSP411 family)